MKNITIIFASLAILLFSCSTEQRIVQTHSGDGKYDGLEFNGNTAQNFEEIWQSVKLINSIAYYNSYVIPRKENLKIKNLIDREFELDSFTKTFFTDNAGGTATILSNKNGNILLLTCAHILDFPDTVITFYSDSDGKESDYIESISVKIDQDNYVSDLPGDGHVEIIALDEVLDAAIIGGKFSSIDLLKHKTFPVKFGNAEALTWGNYVYVFGYPMNRKMVTTGLVSLYESNPDDYFLIDAVFNRGMSGGIVLAVRDGSPNYEFVGMAKSSPADSKIVLKPYDFEDEYSNIPIGPFEGKLKVEREMEMKYGISKVITVNSINKFILSNEDEILEGGFTMPEKIFE
jgi:trypsin-like peptidase